MAGAGYMENIDPALYDERAMAYLFDRYRPHLYGFKLRIGKDISEGMGLRPLEESVKLARKYRTRLSLHATYPLEPMPGDRGPPGPGRRAVPHLPGQGALQHPGRKRPHLPGGVERPGAGRPLRQRPGPHPLFLPRGPGGH